MAAKGVVVLALGLLALGLVAADPAAAERSHPCVPNTTAHRDARARLAALRAVITALSPSDDVAPVRRSLSDLASSECFELASTSVRLPEVRDALTIRRWWEAGGDAYFENMLDAYREPDARGRPTGRPQILVPPDERHSLTLDTAPRHALASLLCRDQDASCGAETAGWRVRAERRLQAFAAEDEVRYSGDGEPTRAQRRAACDTTAARTPRATRFVEWLQCVDAERATVPALPIGRFRAPKTGWIVLRGRRGHYSFCDEVRAYDLATGAAYVAQSCSGLALRHDGSVDAGATDGARGLEVTSGRLPVDALREAALMTMLAPSVDEHVSDNAWYEPLPAGVSMDWEELSFGGFGMRSWYSSGQTQLSWAWVDGGRVVASGALTWPESARAGETHADELWQVAEGGLVAGCAPAALPTAWPLASASAGVSPLDARPDTLRSVSVGLLGTLGARAFALACRPSVEELAPAAGSRAPHPATPLTQAR